MRGVEASLTAACAVACRWAAFASLFSPGAVSGGSPESSCDEVVVEAPGEVLLDEGREFLGEAVRELALVPGLRRGSGEIDVMISRGEGILERLGLGAGGVAARRGLGEVYEVALAEVLGTIADAREEAVSSPVGVGVGGSDALKAIDLWGGGNQETEFLPAELEVVHESSEAILPDLDEGELSQPIPATFRLAELLGLGRNRLRWTGSHVEPVLAREKQEGRWSIVIRAKVLFEVIGRFEGDEERFEAPIETFRLTARSPNRYGIATIRMGDDVPAEHYMIRSEPLERHWRTVWQRGKLSSKLLEQGTVSYSDKGQDKMLGEVEALLGRFRDRFRSLAESRLVESGGLARLEAAKRGLWLNGSEAGDGNGGHDYAAALRLRSLAGEAEVIAWVRGGVLNEVGMRKVAQTMRERLREDLWEAQAGRLDGGTEGGEIGRKIAALLVALNRMRVGW